MSSLLNDDDILFTIPRWRQLWMWVTALTNSSNGAGITGMWLDVEACDHDLSFTLCTYCWTYLDMHNTSMFLDTTLDIYTHPDHRLLLVTSEAALLPRPGLQETYCYIRGRNIWYLDNILITSRTISPQHHNYAESSKVDTRYFYLTILLRRKPCRRPFTVFWHFMICNEQINMHELLPHLLFFLRSPLDNYSAKLQGVAEGKTTHNTEILDCKSHGNEKQ